MARENVQELEAAVVDVLSAAGAPVPAQDLISALQAAGKPSAAGRLFRMYQAGKIVGKVTRVGDGVPPVLSYSLPALSGESEG